MLKLKDQKEIAIGVLKEIQEYVDKDAVIAGGAPRDWDRNELANDIDIFLTFKGKDFPKIIEKLFKVKCGKAKVNAYDVPGLIAVYDVVIGEVKFQFIILERKLSLYRHFDTGISMIAHNGDRLIKTRWYENDIKDKKITVFIKNMPKAKILSCLNAHLPKLKKYYPDHEVVYA